MYYNKVEICGVNTSKLPTLTDCEKRELLLRMKDGDRGARETLIDGNLRLVLSIIQRFSGRRENIDDLFQVGCIGLIKAVDNFNTELDVKFSTYAVPMNISCGNIEKHRLYIPVLLGRYINCRENFDILSRGKRSLPNIAKHRRYIAICDIFSRGK